MKKKYILLLMLLLIIIISICLIYRNNNNKENADIKVKYPIYEYYKLNKFKVLSEITKDEIIYDKKNYVDLLVNNICVKPYLVFRNEIIKEIETKKYSKHL